MASRPPSKKRMNQGEETRHDLKKGKSTVEVGKSCVNRSAQAVSLNAEGGTKGGMEVCIICMVRDISIESVKSGKNKIVVDGAGRCAHDACYEKLSTVVCEDATTKKMTPAERHEWNAVLLKWTHSTLTRGELVLIFDKIVWLYEIQVKFKTGFAKYPPGYTQDYFVDVMTTRAIEKVKEGFKASENAALYAVVRKMVRTCFYVSYENFVCRWRQIFTRRWPQDVGVPEVMMPIALEPMKPGLECVSCEKPLDETEPHLVCCDDSSAAWSMCEGCAVKKPTCNDALASAEVCSEGVAGYDDSTCSEGEDEYAGMQVQTSSGVVDGYCQQGSLAPEYFHPWILCGMSPKYIDSVLTPEHRIATNMNACSADVSVGGGRAGPGMGKKMPGEECAQSSGMQTSGVVIEDRGGTQVGKGGLQVGKGGTQVDKGGTQVGKGIEEDCVGKGGTQVGKGGKGIEEDCVGKGELQVDEVKHACNCCAAKTKICFTREQSKQLQLPYVWGNEKDSRYELLGDDIVNVLPFKLEGEQKVYSSENKKIIGWIVHQRLRHKQDTIWLESSSWYLYKKGFWTLCRREHGCCDNSAKTTGVN